MRKQEKQAVTYLIRPKLSKEERIKKSENEAIMRKRRDEGINSILIADVSEYLEFYKDDEKIQAEIKRYHDTSKAKETFKRLEKESLQRKMYNGRHDWGKDPVDDRETFWDDWWKTDALVAVANKGIKADNRQKRKRAIKDFFYVVSGRRFFTNLGRKKKEERGDNKIVQEFLEDFYLNSFRQNKHSKMSEVLADFLCFIYGRKGFRGMMTDEMARKLADEFIELNHIKEVVNPDDKTLLAFYKFWREK